jgi:hypothetical protein
MTMTSDAAHIHDPSLDPLLSPRLTDRTRPLDRTRISQQSGDPLLQQKIDPSPRQAVPPLSQQTQPPVGPLNIPANTSPALAARAIKIRRILLVLVLVLGMGVIGLKAMGANSASSGQGTSTSSPSASLLTEDLVRLLSDTTNATRVVGSYVPGVGVVISLSVSDVAAEAISQWWSTTVAPIGARFGAELPNDRIVVLIQSAGSRGFARTIVLPTGSVSDVASYRLATAVSKNANIDGASTSSATPDTLDPATVNPATADAPAIDPPASKTEGIDSADSADRAKNANTETVTPVLVEPTAATAKTTEITMAPLLPSQQIAPNSPTPSSVSPAPAVSVAANDLLPKAAALPSAPTDGPTSTAVAPIGTEVLEGFEKASAKWTPISGQWKFLSGSYQQIDNSGFDFISQYADILPTNFSASIKLAAIEGDLNGGLLLFQQAPGKRNEATIVDLTSSSTYLRWGHFDLGGVYVFDGGAKISAPLDQAAGVVLKIEVRGTSAVVFLNDARIGEFIPTKKGGTAGLISSQAKIKFDDFTVRPL